MLFLINKCKKIPAVQAQLSHETEPNESDAVWT